MQVTQSGLKDHERRRTKEVLRALYRHDILGFHSSQNRAGALPLLRIVGDQND